MTKDQAYQAMYCIVLGAEPEGQKFVEMAVNNDHEVTLIEQDEDKARKILQQNSIRVLVGSISQAEILQEAEIARADAVIATTYDDAQNLMAMMLAKENGVAIKVTFVNQAAHGKIFEGLAAKVLHDPARIIAQKLYDLLD